MPHTASTHAHHDQLSRLLELDATIHRSVTERAVRALARHARKADVATVLDIGTGTGAGLFALAAEFEDAELVAIDLDERMLEDIRGRADRQGLGGRITSIRADMGDRLFDAGVADVIWSSNALHEVPDPALALSNMFRSLRRGGVLAIVEMVAPPLVLPSEHASLETGLRLAAGADRNAPDWTTHITAAGFELLETRLLTSGQRLAADGPGGAYAALELRRLAQHAQPELSDESARSIREIVADLSGEHRLIERVHVRGARALWIARRP